MNINQGKFGRGYTQRSILNITGLIPSEQLFIATFVVKIPPSSFTETFWHPNSFIYIENLAILKDLTWIYWIFRCDGVGFEQVLRN